MHRVTPCAASAWALMMSAGSSASELDEQLEAVAEKGAVATPSTVCGAYWAASRVLRLDPLQHCAARTYHQLWQSVLPFTQ